MWFLTVLACTRAPTPSDTGPDPHDRPFDEHVLLVAHNAMNSEAMGFTLPNQTLDYEGQLALGVRGFMLDVYAGEEGPVLCHGPCALGSQPLAEALARFDAWLDAHPDELVVFVLQDEMDPAGIASAFEASGIHERAIVPPADGVWPTWNELVGAGGQLLVTTEGQHDGVPPWLPWAYGLAWDTPYAARTVDDFSCEPLRGDPANPLFLVNHFLTAPIGTAALAETANTREALTDHVDACEASAGRPITWLAVDFVEIGDAVDVVRELDAR